MKKLICKLTLILAAFMLPEFLMAQVGIGTTTPNSSAMLDVVSNTKGLLIPKMTAAQISAINFPATGLLVFQTDGQSGFYFNAGTAGLPSWTRLQSDGNAPWITSGTDIYNSNAGNVGIGTTSPTSKLSVGANSEFQVDNSGNIQKINNIPYSFPASQGTSGQTLINNGTGSLNWSTPSIQTSSLLSGNGSSVTPLTIASPGSNYRTLRTDGSAGVTWAIWGGYSVGYDGGISNAATVPWDYIDFSSSSFGQNCVNCKVMVRFYSSVNRTLYVRFPDDPNPVENVYDIAAGRSVVIGVAASNGKFQYYSNVGGLLKFEFIGFFQ